MMIRRILLTAAVILVASCVTKPELRTHYDQSADFAKYRTYKFVPIPSTNTLGYSGLVTQQFMASIGKQMEQRGYTVDQVEPDLVINFSANLEEKQEIRSSPDVYYGYRAGYYGTWPGYGGDVYTVSYTKGTLNVDIVDFRKRQMVWEGVAVGEVTKKHLENREAAIDKAVEKIFAQYPFRAGEAQPVQPATK
jgi:hypothetical protein